MNLARKICTTHHSYVTKNLYRKFRFSAINYDNSTATQPQIKEEKYNFEDINTLERTERRKAQIQPFIKDVFTSIFNKELLAYPEILNKEETESLEKRINIISNVFENPQKTAQDRRNVLKNTKMYAAPISLTRNGLAANITESLRYLEIIAGDFQIGQEISDHWVALQALQEGLSQEQLSMIIDDLISGDKPVSLAIKEREKDDPKLTLYLAEYLHPSLKQPSEQLEYCVLRMRFACETLMARHGVKISSAYTELGRLAEAATEILVMSAVLARASRAYCIGLRNADMEMKLAACFVEKTRDKVRKLIKEIDDGEYLNLDHFTTQFGRKALDSNATNPTLVEKPTARVFW
ncbi:hypothetical protein HF086_016069 [Spodoptera exigua]|uniref:ACAD9/ACADV-like C-terminal domain-containing protein n=1 Tax=Spodoptera exigua TaxID=7107 RepID=A0A922M5K5_SPOEX|nr:hypothetical protein HF086_016069 [Spodoptera exigua]